MQHMQIVSFRNIVVAFCSRGDVRTGKVTWERQSERDVGFDHRILRFKHLNLISVDDFVARPADFVETTRRLRCLGGKFKGHMRSCVLLGRTGL